MCVWVVGLDGVGPTTSSVTQLSIIAPANAANSATSSAASTHDTTATAPQSIAAADSTSMKDNRSVDIEAGNGHQIAESESAALLTPALTQPQNVVRAAEEKGHTGTCRTASPDLT